MNLVTGQNRLKVGTVLTNCEFKPSILMEDRKQDPDPEPDQKLSKKSDSGSTTLHIMAPQACRERRGVGRHLVLSNSWHFFSFLSSH